MALKTELSEPSVQLSINQSPWQLLLDETCKSGTKLRADPLTLTQLMGWYSLVGCDFDDLSNDEIKEDAWLSIIAPSRPGVSPFAFGQLRLWWEMANIDSWRRDKGETKNFWLLSGLIWSVEPDVGQGTIESEKGHTQAPRSIKGYGIAVLSTLDDNNCPFLEMVVITGGKESGSIYKHFLWRRGHDSRVTLKEIRRLAEEGVTSFVDASKSSGFVGKGKVLMTRNH